MSLIVGKIIGNQIFLVSDTRLYYEESSEEYLHQNTLGKGTIKTIILAQNIALSFAGDLQVVEKVLKKIGESTDVGFISDSIIKVKDEYSMSNFDADFILAYFDTECHMIQFKDGKSLSVENSWIGSINAYKEYKRAYGGESSVSNQFNGVMFSVETMPDNITSTQSEMLKKMQESIKVVIDSDSFEKVGNFCITVAIQNGAFSYMPKAKTYREPIREDELNAHVRFTNSDRGGFTINMFSHSIDSLAIHIRQGKLGILFTKNCINYFESKYFIDVTEIEFNDIMEQEYKVFCSFGIDSTHTDYYKSSEKYFTKDTHKSIRFLKQAIELLRLQMLGYESDVEPKENTLEYFSTFPVEVKRQLCQYYRNLGACCFNLREYSDSERAWNNALIIDSNYSEVTELLRRVPKENL